jgi:hypothetical protein
LIAAYMKVEIQEIFFCEKEIQEKLIECDSNGLMKCKEEYLVVRQSITSSVCDIFRRGPVYRTVPARTMFHSIL